ncbi:hypothetical protein Ahy_A01g000953 [Arachis hypogaea]|uniref:Uncharacterized protein n=1 Tax=Arachis hypogaea TaxID=3818 RepID=A0A445ELV2_ARAHY|nr:hypothetical protein Ahy_A01g000953 [Arachis hypogaea]
MQILNLAVMNAPKFSEYANMGEGNIVAEDGEFTVEIEFGSRESVISAIRSYTISRGVDYTILIQKKGCWEIRRYNGKHMYIMGTISQDHAKLNSDTIADAIRSLVEADPSIKVKSIIAKV